MRNIEADRREDAAEPLEELLSNVPDTDNTDDDVLILGDLDLWNCSVLVVSVTDTRESLAPAPYHYIVSTS